MGDARELLAGHGILEYGRYAGQLESYLRLFPKDQLRVFIFEEDILHEPERALAEACRFLEIDADFPDWEARMVENENRSSRTGLMLGYYLPPLRELVSRVDRRLPGRLAGPSPETLDALYAHYREDNERLFELLGRRIPSWLA